MKITGFLWLKTIVDKLESKHQVAIEEVYEVFSTSPQFRKVEKGHQPDENVYSAAGRTEDGRYLIIYFVHKQEGRALVISARDMDQSERRRYARK